MAKIRTRFAPSPTGSMHIGNLRTAFYAYALAKHEGGDFILRVEDTDKKREVPGGVREIKDLLTTFNLKWDEYYLQSERVKMGVYKNAAEKLVAQGHAYEDEGAIRIKIPKGETVSFHDFVLDEDVSWKTDTLKDLVLLKSDGFPTYHLAVVVDDHDTGITHVLRGHDWLPSTPLHLLVYKYLGYDLPEIGHLTDIQDPGGGKLSKRKGATSVSGLIDEGYLPEALFNFVILLGWAPKDNREFFTLSDFVQAFDHRGFQKANPVFNKTKLDWFNGYYIREAGTSRLASEIAKLLENKYPEEKVEKILPLVKDRMKTLKEFDSLAGFFFQEPAVDKSLLGKNSGQHLAKAKDALQSVKVWNKEALDKSLLDAVAENGFKTGDFFMDVRIAVAGSRFTPPITDSIAILGKDETLERISTYL